MLSPCEWTVYSRVPTEWEKEMMLQSVYSTRDHMPAAELKFDVAEWIDQRELLIQNWKAFITDLSPKSWRGLTCMPRTPMRITENCAF